MNAPGTPHELDAHVRRVDEDRWLASRFAPADRRRALTALYAFHHEIARVGETVSEPTLGDIRLAWWREALEEIDDRPDAARRHHVVQELAAAFAAAPWRPERARLEALIDARARDGDPAPFETTRAFLDYVDATAGALAEAAAGIAAGSEPDAGTAAVARAAGRAWGVVGALRAAPATLARGRTPLSKEWLAAAGAGDRSFAELSDASALSRLAAAGRPVVEAALNEARAARAAAAAWPGYGYAALTRAYLRRLEKGIGGPDPAARPRLARQFHLTAAALRGRV